VITDLGNDYEVETIGSAITPRKVYYAGAQQLAMRTSSGTGMSGLQWMIGFRCGSL
jgi:hypothetical protein